MNEAEGQRLAQHGGPPGWLEESDPAGCAFVSDGRSMPLALTDQTTGRQPPSLSSVLYGIISESRSVLAAQLLLREKSGG